MCFVGLPAAQFVLIDANRLMLQLAACENCIKSWKRVRYLGIPNRLFGAFVNIRMSRMPNFNNRYRRYYEKFDQKWHYYFASQENRVSHCSLLFYGAQDHVLHLRNWCLFRCYVNSPSFENDMLLTGEQSTNNNPFYANSLVPCSHLPQDARISYMKAWDS